MISDAPAWAAAIANIVLALVGVVTAGFAWGTLKQTKEDSARRTRPYVYATLEPSLWGLGTWDLKVHNTGQSAAHCLTADISKLPEGDDDKIAKGLRELFGRPQTIPPGVSFRVLWSANIPKDATVLSQGPGTYKGISGEATITFHYCGDDRNTPIYHEGYTLDPFPFAEIAPGVTAGHNPPDDLQPGDENRHKQMQHVIEALGELRR